MPIETSTVPVTEEHLKTMTEKLFEGMAGLWQIIEDHGSDAMKKHRDSHLAALGIHMNTTGVDGCGTCPACQAKLKEGGTILKRTKEKYDA